MRAILRVVEGPKKGTVYYLPDAEAKIIIGRDRKCDIQIEDSGVSRRHFCISRQGEKFILQDIGSSNGTFVNEQRALWQDIGRGDVIHCGGTKIEFSIDEPSAPKPAPEAAPAPDPALAQKLGLAPFVPPTGKTDAIHPSAAIKKMVRNQLWQLPLEETGKIASIRPAPQIEPPRIEDNQMDIICQKGRQEPPFSEYEDTQKLGRALSTLYKVLELLNSQMTLEELLDVLIKTALDVTKAERGCLLLKKSENAPLETAAFHAVSSISSPDIPISRTVVNLAIEKGLATVSSDAMSDQRLCRNSSNPSSIILNHIRSVMCVPLEGKEHTLGAIYVDNLFARNFFDNQDLEILRAIGRQAGLAVDRALLQEKISKSEQKYRTIFEKAPWCIILANPSGRILDINPAGQELLETAGSGLNRSILDLFPDAKTCFQGLLQSMDSFEIKELHIEGEQDRSMVLHMRGIPLVNEKEELEGGMIIAEDITDAKRLQSQIIHQDKMATIGLLGAGVAHELNNIIAGMMGYAQLVLKRKNEDSLAKVVVEQCRRAHEVVDRLLNFSRRKDTPRKPLQAEELLEDVFQLVSREIERIGIRIVREFAPDTPTILAQPGQIQQVFLNLVMNAMQAMKQDGVLTVRTRHDREWLRVIFQDTGAGIPAKILTRIFEPFFTTKENHGTGLGLAVSYSIVQEYGGEITVESKENQGSTFTIHFPRQTS